MVARLARLFLCLQLLVAVAIAIGLHRAWPALGITPAAVLGLGAVILIRALIAANNFRLAARFRAEHAAPVLGLGGAIRLYCSELIATLVNSSFALPFQAFPGQPSSGDPGVPVLLIHGYGGNSGYWWHLRRRLQRRRIAFHAVDLEPVLGDIEDYLPQVSEAVASLCRATGQARVLIVAHSMGGLVARAWLRAQGGARVAQLITLGTPHAGTGLASFAPGQNSRQMRRPDPREPRANPWLQALNETAMPSETPLISIYSYHDNIVAPHCSSNFPGARNIAFAGVGHVALGSDARVLDCVMADIDATRERLAGHAASGVAADDHQG